MANIKLKKNERILGDVASNLFRGLEGVGGRLKITNQRLIFEPHALNIQREILEIPLNKIKEVTRRNSRRDELIVLLSYRGRGSNPHTFLEVLDFKSSVYTNFTTAASSQQSCDLQNNLTNCFYGLRLLTPLKSKLL